MKFNLVNDDKLQIIISKEDMAKHDMQKWDLAPHNPDAQKLFYEILEEAREACGFDVGNNAQLMIEAYPMTGESLLLTVTKLKGGQPRLPFDLDIEGLGQALMDELGIEDELPEVQAEEAVYRFETLEDVIQAAHLLKPSYDGASQLLRYESFYYLVLQEKEWLMDSGIAVLTEFGDEIRTVSEFFVEHGQMVMAERALEILAAL
ncbi:MAG: adaptor protein MecA [Peptococcaceae bacterium]|nr:adaptor protein MecA [Peptococcaceae bacterium]